MSREIKFRAWYKPFGDRGVFPGRYVYGNKVISFHNMSPDKYELEQYTGLHDVNGIEIYEGDIVSASSGVPGDLEENITGEVKYEDGSYWVDSGSKGTRLWSETVFMKVIGNIHENPELLKEKQ